MQYFEGSQVFSSVPQWVSTFITLGYRWKDANCEKRRICLLSVPFDSEIAGWIALGLMRRDLELESANHLDAHFELILRAYKSHVLCAAKKNSNSSENWDLLHLQTGKTWRFVDGCEFTDSILVEDCRHKETHSRSSRLSPNSNGAARRYVFRAGAQDWQLRGYPPPRSGCRGLPLNEALYTHLPGCRGEILKQNLDTSYDGLVLLGSARSQESVYMKKFVDSGLVIEGAKCPLADLLTINGPDRGTIRRLRSIGERSPQSAAFSASVVVADGGSATIRASTEYLDSDVIGVCSRDASQGALTEFREWIHEISRYYEEEAVGSGIGGVLPKGVLVKVMQRRL